MLKKLKKAQYERLSVKYPNSEPNLMPPTSKEETIAKDLRQTLVDLTSLAGPGSVI